MFFLPTGVFLFFICFFLFLIRAHASQSFYFIEHALLLEIFPPNSKAAYLRGRPHPWEAQETPVLIELVHLTQPVREQLKGHHRKYPTVYKIMFLHSTATTEKMTCSF